MSFQPGDVVFLKSGGQSMTVAAITDENVECIWLASLRQAMWYAIARWPSAGPTSTA